MGIGVIDIDNHECTCGLILMSIKNLLQKWNYTQTVLVKMSGIQFISLMECCLLYTSLAIIEAGISLPGEMGKLQAMIRPEIGIFTHLGEDVYKRQALSGVGNFFDVRQSTC